MKREKIKILDVNFDKITMGELLNDLEVRISNNQKTFVITANPEIVMHAHNAPSYMSIVNQSDYTIADGIGVILGSNILGKPLPERIAGFDLMQNLLKKGNEKQWSAYFLGAKKEVIQQAVKNVETQYPNLKISGWNDGYFNWETSKIEVEIAEKKPDLIFVALGFPKQEKWIERNFHTFNKGLFMGVGGSFDVLAGHVKRSPLIWQKMHLEWLYRLIQQPSRWNRMLVLPLFVIKVLNERFKK
jgi:N-acetylglucosaminyldiphosphoundecaprenol N-acetyl-beta-D-mannosaminyltransferase